MRPEALRLVAEVTGNETHLMQAAIAAQLAAGTAALEAAYLLRKAHPCILCETVLYDLYYILDRQHLCEKCWREYLT